MSYKTIITYLPSLEIAKQVLDVALPLSEAHGAHLIGLHIIPVLPISLPLYPAGQIPIPDDVIEKQKKALEDDAQVVCAEFERATSKIDAKSEWRCHKADYGQFATSIVEQGRCADLVVIAKGTKDPYNTGTDLTARIVLECGRPTLVVPEKNNANTVGKHVLIAWDGGREASRAAYDAIPILKDAESVRIVAVNPTPRNGHGNFAEGDELALGLARHGVKAEVTTTHTNERTAAQELLERVTGHGSDLLVMGCYGHSRVRELFFGGVTSAVMSKMPVPVLMSH